MERVIEIDGEIYKLTENKNPLFWDCELCELSSYCVDCKDYGEPAPCLNKENYYFKIIE